MGPIGMQYSSVLRIEPEFETVVILQCLECFGLVLSHQTSNHNAWHRSLSPAPMREDASGSSELPGDTEVPETPPSYSDDTASHASDPALTEQDTCEHEWPDELGAFVRCLNCGLPYGQWSMEKGDWWTDAGQDL